MYLVVGANGFLGTYILKNILENTEEQIIAVGRDIANMVSGSRIKWISCDISDNYQLDKFLDEIRIFSELKVVFLASCSSPDLVEKNLRYAWDINVTWLSYFINHIANIKCLFYSSSDSVYGDSIDGYKYKEEDELNPVNAYGKQKCVAESIVRWYGYNVVRFPYLIAPSLSPLKKHFYDNIVSKITSGEKIEMFTDSYRSSLNFDTAAKLFIKLMENYSETLPKIINICGDEELSKYDIGLMIAEKFHVDKRLIIPISVAEDSEIFSAERAQSTLMDNSLIKEILGLNEIKFEI